MPFYENKKCPVCGREFSPDDEIVTCPSCGTPHHRECYNSLGHCYNSDKHGTDFEFDENSEKDEGNSDSSVKYYSPQSRDAAAKKESEAQPQGNENPFYFSPPEDEFKDSNEIIDGKPVSDLSAVVLTNTKRFIPKFRKSNKLSWNWSAFIFGPYYLFFRKMYKQGIIFTAVDLIINLVVQGFYAKPISELYSYAYSNMATSASSVSQAVTDEFMRLFEAARPAFIILFAADIVLRIIIALFSDRFYKLKVFEILNNVDKKLEEGGTFQQGINLFESEAKLSQKDLRRLYLGKMGGTNVFAPAMAFIVLDLITGIISRL